MTKKQKIALTRERIKRMENSPKNIKCGGCLRALRRELFRLEAKHTVQCNYHERICHIILGLKFFQYKKLKGRSNLYTFVFIFDYPEHPNQITSQRCSREAKMFLEQSWFPAQEKIVKLLTYFSSIVNNSFFIEIVVPPSIQLFQCSSMKDGEIYGRNRIGIGTRFRLWVLRVQLPSPVQGLSQALYRSVLG